MARRIHDYIVRGEIRNDQRNSVSGWLEVRRQASGTEASVYETALVILSLTGNLTGNLAGQRCRFEVRPENLRHPLPLLEKDFQWNQVGAVGDCTCREVQVAPNETVNALHLEWYSQNGRVVLELADPLLEINAADDEEFALESTPLSEGEPGFPEFTPFTSPDVSDLALLEMLRRSDDLDSEDVDEEHDPYGLFPENLSDQLRDSVSPTDHNEFSEPGSEDTGDAAYAQGAEGSVRSWDEVIPGIDPETKAMYESWDEVIHGTRDEPLTWLFAEPLCLPKPDDLQDEQHAWSALSSLLAAMALRGVAFDMCPHYTAAKAYRLLIEEILPEASIHPDMVATGFTRHYCSWERCEHCDAEMKA